MKKISKLFICAFLIISVSASNALAADNKTKNIIGSWETAVYVDNELLITRVELNGEKEISIKLREFMEHLGYEVTWNGTKRIILAENETDRITVYVDENKCDKNGSIMYVKEPVYISDSYAYLPQHFIEVILGIKTVSVDMMDISNRVNEVEMISDTRSYDEIQESVDNGHQPWRLNPEDTALKFVMETLRFEGTAVLSGNPEKEHARVLFTKLTGEEIHIDLYQPATKGKYGIWEVESWFNENSRQYRVRDLSKMLPIFHNDVNIPENIRETIRQAVVTEWTDVFGVYYKVLGFEATNVTYTQIDDKAEVKFTMAIVTQNYYKDPDTVEYIKSVKANESDYYKRLYEEYNMARMGNVELMAAMNTLPNGEVVPDTLQIFSNISPVGEEYSPVKAEDFIIK